MYGVSGFCTHEDPLDEKKHTDYTFEDAIVFNDKLYCPHHGCAFCITTGTVEYVPAYFNLPRFYVEEKNGKVKLFHPSKIPKKVLPRTQQRDFNDYRKVVILGGDHDATMGCIDGLRQYDYGG